MVTLLLQQQRQILHNDHHHQKANLRFSHSSLFLLRVMLKQLVFFSLIVRLFVVTRPRKRTAFILVINRREQVGLLTRVDRL